jgi:predicted amidohydrolase
MRVALAQVDVRLGEVDANARRAREAIAEARAAGADLVVFPELHLSGYALARVAGTARTADDAARLVGADGPAALLGFHERDRDRSYNSAAYLERGAPVHVHRKLYLVDYAPFDEDAVFAPGDELRAFDTALGRVAVLICNDAWQPFLPFVAVQDGARMLLVPAASSTAVADAEPTWRDLTRVYARLFQCYVVFVNRVGSEGDLTFWGGSHVIDPSGEIVAEAPRLEEALVVADVEPALVDARRRELPLAGEPRLDFLLAALRRVASEH